jgi:hypothetical protein
VAAQVDRVAYTRDRLVNGGTTAVSIGTGGTARD